MHSTLVRAQNVFGYFTTVVFSLAAVIALSVLISPQTPTAKLELRNVQVVRGRPHYYSSKREEYAHIKFDLDADLSSLFNWNTKQVFVYLTATFPTTSKIPKKRASTPYSEAVIWDAVIPSLALPEHHNTYIHPVPKGTKQKSKSSSSATTKGSGKANLAHPEGSEAGILRLTDQKPKYRVTTPAGKIQGLENCTLHLKYNIQPWVGALVWSDGSKWFNPPAWTALGKSSRSSPFEMPGVVDASKSAADLQTETGAEANRGSPA